MARGTRRYGARNRITDGMEGAETALRSSGSVVHHLFRDALLLVISVTTFYFCFAAASEARSGLFVEGYPGSRLWKHLGKIFSKEYRTRQSTARERRFMKPEHQETDLGGIGRRVAAEFETQHVVGISQHKDQEQEREQEHGQLGEEGEELEVKEGEEGGNAPSLTRCYTTPAANPSKGAWRKTDGGVQDSPATVDWPAYKDTLFGSLAKCNKKWVEEHAGQCPMPYYTWEAEECFLDTVEKEKFCTVMAGRKGILFAGDSLSRHMTTTLASVLRADNIIGGDGGRCHDEWSACGGALSLRFQRNDFLDPRTELLFNNSTRGFQDGHCEFPNRSRTRCTIFADDETLGGFDTLVVNSGAHVRPPEKYGPAIEAASKAITASMRRLHGDDAILVARNTATGHWECNERMFEGPVDGDVATRLVAASPKRYNYGTFRGSNRLFDEAFVPSLVSGQKGDDSGWVLLDAYTPSFFRADMHMGGDGPDCLHYCMHGPMDHWVRLLYNIILATKHSKSA
ncbi:unnamed protein product [Ascophyllum nodosum]